MPNRRHFLNTAGLISLTPIVPTFVPRSILAAEPQHENDRYLIVIQLDGGNDGINTVVPYQDEGYEKLRNQLRLAESDLIKLGDGLAFHPRMREAADLFEDGRLSVVHGVGYPNPNRSHFESMAIWHTGEIEKEDYSLNYGWLGGAIGTNDTTEPHAIHVGEEELPIALRGRRCIAASIANQSDFVLANAGLAQRTLIAPLSENKNDLSDFVTRRVSDAYASVKELSAAMATRNQAKYPGNELGSRLQLVSQLIKSDVATRVFYAAQSGYDTHAVQLPTHGNLLNELSRAMKAFLDDMKDAGLEDRVLVMAFSEFGRRVAENSSNGTDHGAAGPVFLAGTKLAKRSYGVPPSLMDLDDGDLKYSTDFRDVYASVVRDWLGIDTTGSLRSFGMKNVFA